MRVKPVRSKSGAAGQLRPDFPGPILKKSVKPDESRCTRSNRVYAKVFAVGQVYEDLSPFFATLRLRACFRQLPYAIYVFNVCLKCF